MQRYRWRPRNRRCPRSRRICEIWERNRELVESLDNRKRGSFCDYAISEIAPADIEFSINADQRNGESEVADPH